MGLIGSWFYWIDTAWGGGSCVPVQIDGGDWVLVSFLMEAAGFRSGLPLFGFRSGQLQLGFAPDDGECATHTRLGSSFDL
ncbi:hypothetical protein RchiOBHm_Chr3g0459151 [Rosa chinensis]|uniref:Uncharacterized protein n=1 Tax=Rosa chinensis TaxID=74649 RepID=A0A2P6R815_ROSCH|nr:hypothetical protein RchiOBHm_Chr3g0459151 [Rosa chinensis]